MKLKELYHRYRTWQKTPSRKWDKGLSEQRCPNCGHSFAGNYCPVCGQQAGNGRITWRWVGKSILDVWGMDSKSLPYTLLQLLLRPGYLIGDYISGHRQACYKPVNMLFIVALFYVIITQLLGHNADGIEFSYGEENHFIVGIFTWLSAHPAWAAMSLTTIMILPTYFLFRFAPRHSRHTLPESIFIQLFMCTLMLICFLVIKFFDGVSWLVPFYYYITYRQLFGYRPWGTLWRLMLSAVIWFFLLCVVITAPIILINATSTALSENYKLSFDLSIFNPNNSNGIILYALAIIVLILIFAAIPLAVGYWISKKTSHSHITDMERQVKP